MASLVVLGFLLYLHLSSKNLFRFQKGRFTFFFNVEFKGKLKLKITLRQKRMIESEINVCLVAWWACIVDSNHLTDDDGWQIACPVIITTNLGLMVYLQLKMIKGWTWTIKINSTGSPDLTFFFGLPSGFHSKKTNLFRGNLLSKRKSLFSLRISFQYHFFLCFIVSSFSISIFDALDKFTSFF